MLGLKHVLILFACLVVGQMTLASESEDTTPSSVSATPSSASGMISEDGESVDAEQLIHELSILMSLPMFTFPHMHLAADIVNTLGEGGHLSEEANFLDSAIDVAEEQKGVLEALLYRFGSEKYWTDSNKQYYRRYWNELLRRIRANRKTLREFGDKIKELTAIREQEEQLAKEEEVSQHLPVLGAKRSRNALTLRLRSKELADEQASLMALYRLLRFPKNNS